MQRREESIIIAKNMDITVLKCIYLIGMVYFLNAHIVLQNGGNETISFRMDQSSMISDDVERKPVFKHFTYKKCGSPDDPGRILKLQLKPTSYGDLIVSASGSTQVELRQPIRVEVDMKTEKLGTYIRVNCVHKFFGSCTFNNICEYGMTPCPFKHMQRAKIPCACPVPAGTYSLMNAEFPVPTTRYAKSFRGKHMLTVNVYTGNRQRLACYNVNVTLV